MNQYNASYIYQVTSGIRLFNGSNNNYQVYVTNKGFNINSSQLETVGPYLRNLLGSSGKVASYSVYDRFPKNNFLDDDYLIGWDLSKNARSDYNYFYMDSEDGYDPGRYYSIGPFYVLNIDSL